MEIRFRSFDVYDFDQIWNYDLKNEIKKWNYSESFLVSSIPYFNWFKIWNCLFPVIYIYLYIFNKLSLKMSLSNTLYFQKGIYPRRIIDEIYFINNNLMISILRDQ